MFFDEENAEQAGSDAAAEATEDTAGSEATAESAPAGTPAVE